MAAKPLSRKDPLLPAQTCEAEGRLLLARVAAVNIGIVSTRLTGLDGVSLEAEKWAIVLERLGHRVYYCAGELGGNGPPGFLVPEMYFAHPRIQQITKQAFGPEAADTPKLRATIRKLADAIKMRVGEFIRTFKIELLIVENALAIPMNIPLGVALRDFIAETGIPTIAHHHDFYWERERYQLCAVPDILDAAFPPDLPSICHVVINSLAQQDLRIWKRLEAELIPNVFDFATPPPEKGGSNADFREAIGLDEGDIIFLQPTRVIPRKGIELAIELVHRLGDPRIKLVITHPAGDEGWGYLQWLQKEAHRKGVDLRYVANRIESVGIKVQRGSGKRPTLWDAYVHADFVTYPSLWEGFGNALLEAIYFRKPVLINRYPVYVADIAPKGFKFVEIDGRITDETVEEVRYLLDNPEKCRGVTDWNFRLGKEHFSLEVLEEKLKKLLLFLTAKLPSKTTISPSELKLSPK
ncbi:MAG: glycosyltransferase family 1 protein [Chloroflexi bacterium]|nr:MAG: glycosyltransferase family 1 protein [Chloroflexota bacterium]